MKNKSRFNTAILSSVFLLVLHADPLNAESILPAPPSPGTPGTSYTWTADSPFGSNPFDDPDFTRLAQAGTFLFTGNTSFHFMGTEEITVWSSAPLQQSPRSFPASVIGFELSTTDSNQNVSSVPEPGLSCLLPGIAVVLFGFRGYRARRQREACN